AGLRKASRRRRACRNSSARRSLPDRSACGKAHLLKGRRMDLAPLLQYLLAQPLLALALAAMALVLAGGLLRHLSPLLGGLVRGLGHLGLFGALMLTIMQVIRMSQ